MEEKKISIIIPVYNVELYIKQCVDSVLSQTYENLEIILVDDGSPDGCPMICDEYAKKDNRVKVVHKVNGGLSDARNFGMKEATGDYIAFIDSDDWIAPDMFEYLASKIEESDIVQCNFINVRNLRLSAPTILENKKYDSKDFLKKLFNDEFDNYVWNRLYKRSLWDNVEFPVRKDFEDILTVHKVIEKANSVYVLREPKYFYRIRENSISGTRDFKQRLSIMTAFCNRFDEYGVIHPEYVRELTKRIRFYYCKEVCEKIVRDIESRSDYLILYDLLKNFWIKNFEIIFSNGDFKKFEKRMYKLFISGKKRDLKKYLKMHKFHGDEIV